MKAKEKKSPMPKDWWNHGINPILGYRYNNKWKGRKVNNPYQLPKIKEL